MGRKKPAAGKAATRERPNMRRTSDWRTPRRSDYGRMVTPKQIADEYDRAAKIRMADQEPVTE